MNNLLEFALLEKETYEARIKAFEAELETLPEGRLARKNVKGKTYFYRRLNDNEYYIKKTENELVAKLNRKKFLQASLKILKKGLRTQSTFIKSFNPYSSTETADNLTIQYPIWDNCDYPKNPFHPEKLIHVTSNGQKVRSKSEVLIANNLDLLNIEFHYEQELVINGNKFYPDFTIKTTKGIIYWEHFGLMGNSDYRNSLLRKQASYLDNNLIPFINIIYTYDNEDGSINSLAINRIINTFILNP